MRVIFQELPALIITLQQLYETSGDAEAYGLSNILATYTGVASVVFLSEILDILARANASMQTKSADFSKFPIFLKVMTDQLEHMKEETSEWLGTVETVISQLQEKYDIVLGKHGSRRSNWSSITSMCEYRTLVAIPYIDPLLENIRNRFSDRSLKIVTAMSIFNPATLPSEESLSSYGNEQIKLLAGFYGEEATVEYNGEAHTSKPLIDASELLSEWKIFRRTLVVEKKSLMERKNSPILSPTMQDILEDMMKSKTYEGVFSETRKLLNIMMALLVSTATVEGTFSQMKLIKTRLRNRLSDSNLEYLMKIAIEGPSISNVDFNEILDIFKQKNRRILL